MVFLSYNPAITAPEDIAEVEEKEPREEELPASLPLRFRWVFWEQLMPSGGKSLPYSESTRQIATCDTVEAFWKTWAQLPQPSELLSNRMVLNVADGFHIVDALMVFREGITPQWEDEANSDGGHLQFQFKPSVGGGQIDEYWNNLVLGVIGGTLEPADAVTGVRLVDKLAGNRGAGNLRMEVWFSQLRDPRAVQTLQRNVEACIATRIVEGQRLGQVPKAEVKNHKLTRHQ